MTVSVFRSPPTVMPPPAGATARLPLTVRAFRVRSTASVPPEARSRSPETAIVPVDVEVDDQPGAVADAQVAADVERAGQVVADGELAARVEREVLADREPADEVVADREQAACPVTEQVAGDLTAPVRSWPTRNCPPWLRFNRAEADRAGESWPTANRPPARSSAPTERPWLMSPPMLTCPLGPSADGPRDAQACRARPVDVDLGVRAEAGELERVDRPVQRA